MIDRIKMIKEIQSKTLASKLATERTDIDNTRECIKKGIAEVDQALKWSEIILN